MLYRAPAGFTDCAILAARPGTLSVCDCSISDILLQSFTVHLMRRLLMIFHALFFDHWHNVIVFFLYCYSSVFCYVLVKVG